MRILVTSIGSFSADAVISSLRSMNASIIIGCNSTPAEWIVTSNLVDRFYSVTESKNEKTYTASLLDICKKEKIEYIIPLTDIEIDTLNKNRDAFKAISVLLCMPSAFTINIARNKLEIFKRFENDELVTTIKTKKLKDIDESVATFPSVIKPIDGRSSQGLFNVCDIEELIFYKKKLDQEKNIIQPYIEGDIWVADIVRSDKDGSIIIACRKELIRTSNGAGMTVSIEHNPALQSSSKYIAESLKLNGCINIEFITHNKTLYLMDINPRFSAGIGFSKLAGLDLIKNSMSCFNGTQLDITPITPMIVARSHKELIMNNSLKI